MVAVAWRESPFQSCLGPERWSTCRCGCGSEPATRCASEARAYRRMPRSRARINKTVPVLSRNFLHDAVREKSGKDADPRRVNRQRAHSRDGSAARNLWAEVG